MLILPIEIDQTASGGVWAFNSPVINGGMLYHVVCVASNGATTFNFTITDDKDNVIYTPTNATGAHRAEVQIPVRGVITIGVNSASADNAFTGRLMIEEM